MAEEEAQHTEFNLLIAGVKPSFFDKGRWTAHAVQPEQIRLGTYDTETEATARAAEYANAVVDILQRSYGLRRLLERIERTRPN